jgi:large subunit ribosomal protein L29
MKVKADDIRNLTEDEIHHKVIALREEIYKLTFEKRCGRIEKPHRISQVKKELARCLTVLGEKAKTTER